MASTIGKDAKHNDCLNAIVFRFRKDTREFPTDVGRSRDGCARPRSGLLSFTLEQTTRAEMNPARAESREDNRVPPRTAANYHYGFRFLGELSARWEDQHAPEA